MKCQSTDNERKHLTPPSLSKGRPLSISSVSSAASSNSSSSANSSASSGVQSSLTRNGSLNYGHEYRKWAYLASIDSLDNPNNTTRDTLSVEIGMKELNLSPLNRFKDSAAARAAVLAAGAQSRNFATPGGGASRCPKPSTKLQPSPSSVSSHSNNSSLFRDDGFEDDIASTASEHAPSTTYHQHHRLSFQSRSGQRYRHHYHHHRHHQRRNEEDEDEYQSCEEEISNSQTTASTASNIDDCALSTTSSSIIQPEHQVFDKISLAQAKQQYRKSLLLEHQQQQQQKYLLNSQHHGQTKIQSLISTSPKLPHLGIISHNSSANINAVSNNGCTSPSKQSKCDDRTVNIIGHMPTKNPGYWDSNLSIAQRVVTEIIETERTYVDDLEQIVTGYICYLRNVLKQQKQQQQREHNQSKDSDSNLMVTDRTVTDDDDKSMFVFNDDTTSATNDVDDYDVEEAENDLGMRENIMPNVKQSPLQTKSETSEGAIMTATHIKKLFSNLEDIYKFNKDLLFRLEECYLNPSSVAECFVENASGFEVYTHYCTMYPQVVSTLTELMSNQTSAQSLRERQNDLNQSLPLGAYLLKPVQRILKYHILFQSLIKHTTDDDSVGEKDRQLINEAFSVMTNIACHINTMKKRHEHAIRVQEVQGLLSGWEVGFINLQNY